ncbi:MAG: radical SAM protein [Candidatus Omnitrophica bacterium]|nr:radical SAM protein [Candidatus Omnitrophota bacterium]MDD5352672.1 radical SAM protein [Candidatus Omnitrophota bacterium]MDD5550271.1 radical SAM protein [Candidatus Omnitrophota bacterium]
MLIKKLVQITNKFLPEKPKLHLARFYSRLPFSPPRIGFTPLLECNYSCSYCFNKNYINPYFRKCARIDYQEWVSLFNKFPTSLVTIGGGEPLLYKDMDKLIQGMAKKHIISQVITNLSVNLDVLIKAKKSGFRVMASFHPEMIIKEEFLKSLLYLKNKGLKNIMVNYIATPQNLEKYGEYKEFFEKKTGYFFRLDAYEDLKRDLSNIGQYQIYGINYLADREKYNNYLPKKCNGGSKYLVVMPDASVYRCGVSLLYIFAPEYKELVNPLDLGKFYIGNLKDSNFKIDKKDFVCHSPCRWICDIELANVRKC